MSSTLTSPGPQFRFGSGEQRSFGFAYPSFVNMGSVGHSPISPPSTSRLPQPSSYTKPNPPSFDGSPQSHLRSSTYSSDAFATPRLPSQRSDSISSDMGRPESLPSHRLKPTWHGFVGTSEDALKIFESTLTDKLHIVKRRPRDGEKTEIIASGNVFVYDEDDSGIKRWTDGKDWSPSRIRGNFLLYREVSEPFRSNGRKLNSNKRSRTQSHDSAVDGLVSPTTAEPQPTPRAAGDVAGTRRDQETSIYGSLTDSYSFKDGGLMKKTMSVSFRKKKFHLVAYYHPDHVSNSRLRSVDSDSLLANCKPRRDFYENQNFRAPMEGPYHHHEGLALATPGGQYISPHNQMPPQPFSDIYGSPSSWQHHQYQPVQTQYTTASLQPMSSYGHLPQMYITPQTYVRPNSSRASLQIQSSYGPAMQSMPAVAHSPMSPLSPMTHAFPQNASQSMPPTPQSLSPTTQSNSFGQMASSMQQYQQMQHPGMHRHSQQLEHSQSLQNATSMAQSTPSHWAYQDQALHNLQAWQYHPPSL